MWCGVLIFPLRVCRRKERERRMRAGGRWRLALAAICCLSAVQVTLSNREEMEILASSGFDHSRPQGWAVQGKGTPSLVMEAGGRLARVLVARGHGGKSNGWGFVAPPEYLGDKGVAYGGRIEFTLRHADKHGEEADIGSVWGIKIDSREMGLTLGARTMYGFNRIVFECGSWTVIRGKGQGYGPTQKQLAMLLSTLSSITIRGGFFSGMEMTFIDDVRLVRGPHSARVLANLLNKAKDREEEKVRIEKAPFAAKRYGVGIVLSRLVESPDTPMERQVGLLIKRLVPESPAALNGRIQVGALGSICLVFSADPECVGSTALPLSAKWNPEPLLRPSALCRWAIG